MGIIDDKQAFKDVFKKLELFTLVQEEIKGGQGWCLVIGSQFLNHMFPPDH